MTPLTFRLVKTSIFTLFILISFYKVKAQTTSIPDSNFEQALIDKGIDSDATLNGQVLTSDISGIIELDISNLEITDISGIEDFTSLEILDISFTPIGASSYPFTLDLSPLINLEEIYMNSDGDNTIVAVNSLELTNNIHLNKIEATYNWPLRFIDLQGSDLQIDNLIIDKSNDISDPLVCIQVTIPQQAENSQGVYANWQLDGYFSFSEDCTLNVEKASYNKIELYPNPTTDAFHINSPKNIEVLKIYNLQGKLIKEFSNYQENYSVADLEKGVYIVSAEKQSFKEIFKLVIQ